MNMVIVTNNYNDAAQLEIDIKTLTKKRNEIRIFEQWENAHEYLTANRVEVVFMQVDWSRKENELICYQMRSLREELVLICMIDRDEDVISAYKAGMDLCMIKNYSMNKLREMLEKSALLSYRYRRRIYVKMFGRFDVFVDGTLVHFSNQKSKELLALCVEHNGGSVTIEEAIDKLWEGRSYDERVKNLYRKAIMDIRTVLRECDAEEFFISHRGSCNIKQGVYSSDYSDLIEGRCDSRLLGRYLEEYSWAEEMAAKLENYFNDYR